MGLTSAQEKVIRRLLDSWDDHTRGETTDDLGEAAKGIVKVLGGIVNTYQYGHDEIEILLHEAFVRVLVKGRGRGYQLGEENERKDNPAIRSAGECVKVAREAERKALRTTLRTVFDAETTRGTNPFYAFNEALKAIE